MKEHTLFERVLMVLRVIASTVGWVSRIVFKIARGMLPGAAKSAPISPATYQASDRSSPKQH